VTPSPAPPPDAQLLARAAATLASADALLVTAGAGLGVDSGLPDFRGNEGFWRAYPPFARLGLSFVELANPAWFDRDPALAWGFYGHRLELYRATTPHAGFGILHRWNHRAPRGGFVFTSNVDGHFLKAGFDHGRLVECHGSIHHLQCTRPCGDMIWPAPPDLTFAIDPETMRAQAELPRCPHCGAVARPNVLMFGDDQWVPHRTDAQAAALAAWLGAVRGARLVIVELGAGRAVPTVRHLSESVARRNDAPLIRINPREPEGPPGTLPLAGGALATLEALVRFRDRSDNPSV
jgi:NAD-dependent SIR2 family protein deacetylase